MWSYHRADFISNEDKEDLSLSGFKRKEVELSVIFKDGGSERVTYSNGIGVNPCSRS